MRKVALTIVTTPVFEKIVITAILLNAVTLGLETYPAVMTQYGSWLRMIDTGFILFFVCELLIKLFAYRTHFFRSGWNWFDLSIVTLTVLPALGITGLGNVSAFRALRLLRLLSVIPSFRRVLSGIMRALQDSVAVMCVLSVILFVYATVAVKLFGEHSPEYFGDLDTAFFTFFQIMTLDAWSEIVRPLMEVYPFAGLFVVSFIVVTVFILLSIMIGIASSAMNKVNDDS